MKTNGYAAAMVSLQPLQSMENLTPEQAQAVRETSTALYDQIHEAAAKGDPNAKTALDELRRMRGR